MKRSSGALFPILLLSALAALTFWLEQATQVPLKQDDGKSRHDPDTIVEHFTLRQLSTTGTLQYKLISPKATRYADDESTHLQQPKLTQYKPGSPDLNITSERGLVTQGGTMVLFEENVVAHRAAHGKYQAMVASTPDLTVLPDDGKAYTTSRVDISEGPSWIRGTGMELDSNAQLYKLLSRVTGTIYNRNNPKP